MNKLKTQGQPSSPEIAEMHLDGTLCEQCGEYLGEAVGEPRLCEGCSPKDRPSQTKVLSEIKYRDLADLIFILQDTARAYHNLDDYDELTVNQFTEWLCEMKGSVQLTETSFK